CPLGTVLSRLAWARERLRGRLLRRRVIIPAGLVAAILAERAAAVALPALLLNATVQAAATFGSAQAGAAQAAALAKGFLRAQSLWKWTKAAGLLAGAGLVILLVLFFTQAPEPKTDQELPQGIRDQKGFRAVGEAPKPKTDQELLQGTWKATK